MVRDRISIKKVKGIDSLSLDLDYPESRVIAITGKNGAGKTTLVKSFGLAFNPQIIQESSGLNAINSQSKITFDLDQFDPFTFEYNPKVKALDTKDRIPSEGQIVAELPIPYGNRFKHFSLVSAHDAELRANIASSQFESAHELIEFLNLVYSTDRYSSLLVSKVKKNKFYFFLRNESYYLREDHLSSGEFFLIQIFRLISSGASIILIDELDVALDATAQVNLYSAIKPLLEKYQSRLIVVTHSLAFMETVEEGGLYYLERHEKHITLEKRSFGYIKSDLYGFRGKDRFILTEDKVLGAFIKYLIKKYINYFYEFEIVEVGGHPQVSSIAQKNDDCQIFGSPDKLLIVVDRDIIGELRYDGKSTVCCSPVDDIELYLWSKREELLPDVRLEEFQRAKKDKDTAKTFCKKVIASGQKTADELFQLVCEHNSSETENLVGALSSHLCL